MKAEQRKELETNTLADKMGGVMKRVRSSPRRTFLMYLIGGVALAAVLYFTYNYVVSDRQETSVRWVNFYDGAGPYVNMLAESDPLSYSGKAARFQMAWIAYWEGGIKLLGHDARGSMSRFKEASRAYQKLAEDCKDDPIFEPQALLGIAVVEECKAIQDRSFLEKAKKYYKVLTDHEKYKDTYQGKFAKERLEVLDKKELEVANVYSELQRIIDPHGILAPQPQMQPNPFFGQPGVHPELPQPKQEDKQEKKESKENKEKK